MRKADFNSIQRKHFAEDYKLRKEDIDSFFTTSGKKSFRHRIIVSTCCNWKQYDPKAEPVLEPKKRLRPHQVRAVQAAVGGLSEANRGELIVAFGTSKTSFILKQVERMDRAGKRIMF